jgi:hypothetical protein
LAHIPFRLGLGDFENIMAFFDIFPKIHVFAIGKFRQISAIHAEWINLHLHRTIAALMAFPHQGINLANLFVCHGIATAR